MQTFTFHRQDPARFTGLEPARILSIVKFRSIDERNAWGDTAAVCLPPRQDQMHPFKILIEISLGYAFVGCYPHGRTMLWSSFLETPDGEWIC